MEAKVYHSLGSELKLCTKCKYSHKYYNGRMNIYECNHASSLKEADPVNGDVFYTKCDAMREYSTLCGSTAKLFEPKLPLLDRIKAKFK